MGSATLHRNKTCNGAVMPPAIERLLRPRSVAIVGASATPGALGAGVLANLERFGFAGDIHLINPNRNAINGRPCLRSTHDLPQGVDCAVFAIPSSGMKEAMAGCAARGVGGAVIFAGGFAEAGPAGHALQDEISDIARQHGIVLEGPNCLGFVNNVDRVALTFSPASPIKLEGRRAVGIVSQSGAMASVLRAAFNAHDVAFSYAISTGNEAVSSIEDYIAFLMDDDATTVIALIAEQFRHPRRFLDLARTARERGKLIVVLHPGRSVAAQISAQTHTAAMSGDWQVMRAFVGHAGAVLVDTIEELIDVSEMLVRFGGPLNGGLAVLTESGIFKGQVLDLCEQLDIGVPEPSPPCRDALAALAPDLILPSNPLDLTAQALVDPNLFPNAMNAFLKDDHVGCLMLSPMCPHPALTKRRMEPLIEHLKQEPPPKPVVFAMLGDDAEVPAEVISGFRQLDIPFFRSPERALRALGRISHIEEPAEAPLGPRASRPPSAEARTPIEETPVEEKERAGRPRSQGAEQLRAGTVPEYLAKQLLSDFGFPVPQGELARDLDAAAAVAARIGFPVALKAQSADLSHKSDAGGVVLGVRHEADLIAAWTKLHDDIARARPGLVLDGVLVEAMAAKGFELILGARNDKDWGPVLLIGLGGVWTEALGDIRVLPPYLSPEQIAGEFHKLRGAKLLSGFRGAPPVDVTAAADVTARLGAFVLAHPEIMEIELNPVVVYAEGKGAFVLDAVIEVGEL
jgi:acyl-CoA synthetase (NDP forming)